MKQIYKKFCATPLTSLTVGDLIQILHNEFMADRRPPDKRYVYGLRGIRELFHVSTKTAKIWKDTFLRDAVYQSGRTIVTDVDLALKLFDQRKDYGKNQND